MQKSGLTEIITFLCISVADGCQMAGIVLPGHPPGSEIHTGGLESRMVVTSVFIDMAGNIPHHINS